MPCVSCCGCNEPFGSRGQPTSVEIDMTRSSVSASMSGLLLGVPYDASLSMSSLSATYSLAFNGFGFVYEAAPVRLAFTYAASGGIGYASLDVRQRADLSMTWAGVTLTRTGIGDVQVQKECDLIFRTSTLGVISSFTPGSDYITCGLNTGGFLGAWDFCVIFRGGSFSSLLSPGCQIPWTHNFDVGTARYTPGSWTTSSSTFASSDYTASVLRDWSSATSTISEIRLLYGSDVVPYYFGAQSC